MIAQRLTARRRKKILLKQNRKKGAVKKSATKPVDFLDMEAHGL